MTLSFSHRLTRTRRTSLNFEAGEKVIWWKRILGGNYVSPVSATVLAVTAKRIKDEIGFLLTADQAEKLAAALRQAAQESRMTPG